MFQRPRYIAICCELPQGPADDDTPAGLQKKLKKWVHAGGRAGPFKIPPTNRNVDWCLVPRNKSGVDIPETNKMFQIWNIPRVALTKLNKLKCSRSNPDFANIVVFQS